MAVDDQVLVDRYLEGETSAFDELMDRYEQKVYNLAMRMTGNPEDAYDMAQEAFLRVFKSLHRFRGNSSFSTWLYRVASNVCLDFLRKRKRSPVYISIDESLTGEDGEYQRQFEDGYSPDPEELVSRVEMQEAIQEQIGTLSDDHRLVILLRDAQGRTYQEIADILQISIGTVKSRLYRARRELRDKFTAMELFNFDFVRTDDNESHAEQAKSETSGSPAGVSSSKGGEQ